MDKEFSDKFYIVSFSIDNTVEIVPRNWLRENGAMCYWPLVKNPYHLIETMAEPDQPDSKGKPIDWNYLKVRLLHHDKGYDSVIQARKSLSSAEYSSDWHTEQENDIITRDTRKSRANRKRSRSPTAKDEDYRLPNVNKRAKSMVAKARLAQPPPIKLAPVGRKEQTKGIEQQADFSNDSNNNSMDKDSLTDDANDKIQSYDTSHGAESNKDAHQGRKREESTTESVRKRLFSEGRTTDAGNFSLGLSNSKGLILCASGSTSNILSSHPKDQICGSRKKIGSTTNNNTSSFSKDPSSEESVKEQTSQHAPKVASPIAKPRGTTVVARGFCSSSPWKEVPLGGASQNLRSPSKMSAFHVSNQSPSPVKSCDVTHSNQSKFGQKSFNNSQHGESSEKVEGKTYKQTRNMTSPPLGKNSSEKAERFLKISRKSTPPSRQSFDSIVKERGAVGGLHKIYSNQSVILAKLNSMDSKLETLLLGSNALSSVSVPDGWPKELPLRTMDSLNKFEKFICLKSTNYSYAVDHFKTKGGQDGPTMCRSCLKSLLSDDLRCLLNWEGSELKTGLKGTKTAQVILGDLPKFVGSLNNVTVAVGREALLTCVVENLLNYKVAWLQVDTQTILTIHGTVITKNHRVKVTQADSRTWQLHIRDVRETDGGWYMCQLNTDPMKSQQGYLEVVVPPNILDDYPTSTDMVVREGRNVSLRCAASGSPTPTITWRREDGRNIRVGNAMEVPSFEGTQLSIQRVDRLSMGAYLCIASNGVPPSVSKRLKLIVHFPPMITIPNQLVGAMIGQNLTLECISEAFPKSINYWMRNNEIVTAGSRHEPSLYDKDYTITMRLHIKNVKPIDFTAYKCISKNNLGETDGQIRIEEIIQSTTPTTTSLSATAPAPGKGRKEHHSKTGKENNDILGARGDNSLVKYSGDDMKTRYDLDPEPEAKGALSGATRLAVHHAHLVFMFFVFLPMTPALPCFFWAT